MARHRISAAAVTLLLGAAGCGGSDESSGGGATRATPDEDTKQETRGQEPRTGGRGLSGDQSDK